MHSPSVLAVRGAGGGTRLPEYAGLIHSHTVAPFGRGLILSRSEVPMSIDQTHATPRATKAIVGEPEVVEDVETSPAWRSL